jgi:hypothetical protein
VHRIYQNCGPLHVIIIYSATSPPPFLTMEPLTVGSVQQAIEMITAGSSTTAQWLDKKGFRLQPAKDPSDWQSIIGYYHLSDSFLDDAQINENSADGANAHPTFLESTHPMRFGIIAQKNIHNNDSQLCGIVTFYIGYSTWDGRILYVDRLVTSGNSEERGMTEMSLLTTLAGIATSLNCTRLIWTVRLTKYLSHDLAWGSFKWLVLLLLFLVLVPCQNENSQNISHSSVPSSSL